MNDGISILVALFIILMGLRWLMGMQTSSFMGSPNGLALTLPILDTFAGTSQPRAQRRPPLAQPRRLVTPEMVDAVRQMFPSIPPAAILADLQKTGSVEITCDNILRDGGLPLPPLPASLQASTSSAGSSSSSSATSKPSAPSLVHRYKLQDKVVQDVPEEPAKVWEGSADKRHDVLKKRKEFMVLQARKKFLEQQRKKEEEEVAAAAAASSLSSVLAIDSSDLPLKPDVVDPTPQTSYEDEEPSLEQLNAMTPEERRKHMLEAVERRRQAATTLSSSS